MLLDICCIAYMARFVFMISWRLRACMNAEDLVLSGLCWAKQNKWLVCRNEWFRLAIENQALDVAVGWMHPSCHIAIISRQI